MTTDRNRLLHTIFCMLSYAFRVLNQTNYEGLLAEEFESAEDLLAAVLAKGTAQQVKRGLQRTYQDSRENLSVMRGKINVPQTIRRQVEHQQKLSCEFDELTENTLFNQILKTTIQGLLTCKRVKPERQRALRQLTLFFGKVDVLKPAAIPWRSLRFERSSQNYEMLLHVCYLVWNSLPAAEEDTLLGFSDHHMTRLYETFLLEYYKKHHTYLKAYMGKIRWNLQGEQEALRFLPEPPRKLMLQLEDRLLIIDPRYYGQARQQQFSRYSLQAENLNRIFTCVKNQDVGGTGRVAGVLLYARTAEELQPACDMNLGGSLIMIRNLNWNQSFDQLAGQLDRLAFDYFGMHELSR